ncbi:4-(cytidine 5'-diphospho)-2-C-methyl-D-erythritol kinase [Sphingomonas humi]|uniref:4-diphosphocytidyl-2-C-methyl-D-erythritol kinase n=1 Tax=Sphingomonas humi TaxID=335630 RepID=A0ABP7SBX1_9SPHN
MSRPPLVEVAPAKLNLALHVRGRRADGRHDLETIFAFCTDGDKLTALESDDLSLTITGPFAAMLDDGPGNLVHRAASALAAEARVGKGVALTLEKNLPVASGIGGGSADAGAALRLLTRFWGTDPALAQRLAPELGSDVPACLLSMTARGTGAGDALELVDAGVADTPVLLVNPMLPLSTRDVFAGWDGVDRGPLGDWREGRNDLEAPARRLVPAIGEVLDWFEEQDGVDLARMSGSGATCFALFETEDARDAAAAACPEEWWQMASFVR